MEDQQVMRRNSTERPTATKRKKEKFPMSRESVVRKYQVGHRKKHPTSRNFIIVGEKVSQKEKIPSCRFSSITKSQVSPKKTHPTRRNFWVVREKVSLKEKFPASMDFRVKKTQVSLKYKLWELKNQIMCNVKTVCPKE
jgi:hypothetical protein